ncbi:MAG: hypothetical protein M0Q53_18370 [Prolixibacteraceae bacterium]|jgi:hypothetical protein|nr:hypothetical protein [Prolixibacteraceae bacterium]
MKAIIWIQYSLLSILALCFTANVHAQSLKYEHLGFNDALSKAKRTNQILFIQLESDCLQCNDVAASGLSGDELNTLFSKFVCLKVLNNSEDYKQILSTYHIYPNLPTSLFVDSKGNYLASLNNFSTSNKNEYFKLAAKALATKENPPFQPYTDAIAKNGLRRESLKTFITKLNELNFNTDSLLENYIEYLTIRELRDETELSFLIQSAPLVNSRVYNLIRLDYLLFKKVFESFPMDERIKINQNVLTKSKSKLFREKSQDYLYYVNNFIRGMYGESKREGFKAAEKLDLEFYKEAKKDYNTYYNLARGYYRDFYGKLNIDSVRTIEMNRIIKRPDGSFTKGGMLYQTGNELNDIAFTIFESTDDKEKLAFALKLSEMTLKYNVPAFIDTYAKILYRFGGKKDAIDWQKKAIAISDSLHLAHNGLKEALTKMQAGTL